MSEYICCQQCVYLKEKEKEIPKDNPWIGTIDNDGVLFQALLFQVGQHAAHVLVHRGNATQVILHIALVLPAYQVTALQVALFELCIPGLKTASSTPRDT